MLTSIVKSDNTLTKNIQHYYRFSSKVQKLLHKKEIISANKRKAESHTKFMLGGMIVKAELHTASNIKLGDDLTSSSLEHNVAGLLASLESLVVELNNNNYHFDTLAATGARCLAYNPLTKYGIGSTKDVIDNFSNDDVPGSDIANSLKNEEIHIIESQSKLNNRTLIQLGGIVVKSGLLKYFNLELGHRLQHDYNIRKNVNALFGALISMKGA